jgi:hypothetical protein
MASTSTTMTSTIRISSASGETLTTMDFSYDGETEGHVITYKNVPLFASLDSIESIVVQSLKDHISTFSNDNDDVIEDVTIGLFIYTSDQRVLFHTESSLDISITMQEMYRYDMKRDSEELKEFLQPLCSFMFENLCSFKFE